MSRAQWAAAYLLFAFFFVLYYAVAPDKSKNRIKQTHKRPRPTPTEPTGIKPRPLD